VKGEPVTVAGGHLDLAVGPSVGLQERGADRCQNLHEKTKRERVRRGRTGPKIDWPAEDQRTQKQSVLDLANNGSDVLSVVEGFQVTALQTEKKCTKESVGI